MGEGGARFGAFELDLRTGELRKGGFRVRLQEQPLRILVLLVERVGELVTREDLRQRLWSQDTFVDFDRGLNNAVRRLREALGDSADAPRFIETLARRGYRFIAPVERVLPAVPEAALPAPVPASAPVAAARPRPARPRTALLALLAGVALLVALYGAWPRPLHGRGAGPRHAGRPALREPERRSRAGLLQRRAHRGDDRAPGRLQPSELGVIARISAMHYKGTQKRADEIGRELGVGYVLESSVRRSGNRVRVTAQLSPPRTQEHLWSEVYEREVGDVLRLQVEISEAIARQVQVRLTPPHQARLVASPLDPEAHSLYLKGRFFAAQRTPDGLRRALALYEEALAREPRYAAAQAGVADANLSAPGTGWRTGRRRRRGPGGPRKRR